MENNLSGLSFGKKTLDASIVLQSSDYLIAFRNNDVVYGSLILHFMCLYHRLFVCAFEIGTVTRTGGAFR